MKRAVAALLALSLSACASVPANAPLATVSTPSEPLAMADAGVLFWDRATRDERFRHMEDHFAGLEAAPASAVRALPKGKPLDPATIAKVDGYLDTMHAAGIMVLQDGKIRYEHYRMNFGPQQRWTSFSVAKSFTSTLLGAALEDGYIASLSDPVTEYLPQLKGSAYDGVTVEQIATMASGVKWNEDYTDPKSDVAQMLAVKPVPGETQEITYAKTLTREAPAGRKWVYKTLETGLLGDIVAAATHQPLATYAKRKIVDPAGFAGPLFWMTDLTGSNIGGCCLSLRLSDYARMGQWVLEGGRPSVPGDWFARAGSPQVDLGDGYGYGYQWWTFPGGNFGAQGIFGQYITIVPSQRLVVAVVGDYDTATGKGLTEARRGLWRTLIDATRK